MHFMNEWEIEEAVERHKMHPILGPATRTLLYLMQAVNACSDGWAYWSAPVKAADKLMRLVELADSDHGRGIAQITVQDFKKTLTPIKSFCTKHPNVMMMFPEFVVDDCGEYIHEPEEIACTDIGLPDQTSEVIATEEELDAVCGYLAVHNASVNRDTLVAAFKAAGIKVR